MKDGEYQDPIPLNNNRYTCVGDVWPTKLKGRRNYRFSVLRLLPKSEWLELARLVRKRAGVKVCSGTERNRNNAARKAARLILLKMRAEPGHSTRHFKPVKLLLGRKRECRIMSALLPSRDIKWKPVAARRRHHSIRIENFSLIDNPYNVMTTLRDIAELEAISAGVTVDFEDQSCLDVSPYLILGLMRQNMIRVVNGGTITPAVRSMLNAVDLAGFMGVSARTDHEHDPTFVPFKLRHRRRAGTSTSTDVSFQPSSGEKMTDDLVTTVDNWLRTCGRPGLTKAMKGYVANLVNEVLDNAVRHSDLLKGDGDWAMAGFLSAVKRPDDPSRSSYFCSLAMVSVGATIHESIHQSANVETVAELSRYASRHGDGSRGPAEALSTVFALQDGVSRFPQGDGDSKGGVGLMDTVHFTSEISAATMDLEQPRMTLVSGRACLSLRGPYRSTPHQGSGGRRELWFNQGNTLEQPPDPNYVGSLKEPFPGAIVALRFCVGASSDGMKQDRIAA